MDQSGCVCKGMDRRLYKAAKSGSLQVVNEIVGLEDVVNEVTPGGNTVLHIAAYHISLQFVQKLLQLILIASPEDGVEFLKAKNVEGNTALHEAALGGKEEVVKALLQSCSDLVKQINLEGETALFKACERGHAKITQMLCPSTPMSIEYYKRHDGQTPLHLAVSTLHRDVIEVLLRHKSELATQADNSNRIPLHMAALLPYVDFFRFPLPYKKIHLIGELLIKENTLTCYKVDKNKQTALHIAVREGNVALVKVIVNYSSDCLEMVDNDGRNALHLAVNNAAEIFVKVAHGLRDIIYIVTSERLINCKDTKEKTALDIAIEKENEDPQLYGAIIRYLCEHGAVKKTFDEGSRTNSSTHNLSWNSNVISVSAVLIATVAFAAAFTLPGGIGIQGQSPPAPILINANLFQIFVIFDTVAFCYSIGSAILLNFACFASKLEDPILTNISLHALWIALVALSITFGAAIHLVVASKCLWLAVLVWVMVCLLPICIRAVSLFGKLFLFIPPYRYINWLLLSFGLPFATILPIVWLVWMVSIGILHNSLSWFLESKFWKQRLGETKLWKKLHDIKSRMEI